jgi:hypothetical protein
MEKVQRGDADNQSALHVDVTAFANVLQRRLAAACCCCAAPTSGTMCTSASAVMMPPLNARSSRGTSVFVFLNQSVIKLHMEAAKMTKSPATLQHEDTQD